MKRKHVVAAMALLLATPHALFAADLSGTQMVKIELAIRFDHSRTAEVAVNGIAIGSRPQRAAMTCPPQPDSCAPMVTAMSAATLASLVFLSALSRNRDR